MSRHLVHVFATFTAGGPQVRTARLLNALAADPADDGGGWRHSVVSMDGREDAAGLVDDAVELRLVPRPASGGGAGTVLALRRLLRSLSPDRVLTYNWGAIEAVWAARLAGLEVVHHEDGFRPDEVDGFKRRRELARRFTLPATRAVVVPSHTLETIARERWRLSAERVRLVPNGVRLEDFASDGDDGGLRARLGIPADALVVGSVGHLRAEKNLPRLAEAFAAMRTEAGRAAHLLVLGEGPERPTLERRLEALGLSARAHLLGHVEDTAPCYRAMDVFAMSSDTEQMPVALLEAMASGLPACSTDVGDVSRIVADENRDAVVPVDGDPSGALGAALDRLASSPDGRERIGAANRRRVAERYSFDAMLAAYRELYSGR